MRGSKLFLITLLLWTATTAAQEREEIAVELGEDRAAIGVETIEVSDEFVRAAKFADKYFELGEMAAALEYLQEADAMLTNHPAILYNTAVVLVRMARYAEAEERIESYLSLYPDGNEAEYVKNLQIDLEFQKDLERKQQSNQDYVELFNRGKFAYEEGEFQRALDIFRQAEQMHPEDAAAIYNQALSHEALGNYEKATERLRQFLAVNRDGSVKTETDRKIFQLEGELEQMRSSFVCAFCGFRLPIGATWCHRCWHGPYLLDSPRLNTLPCGVGASATRTSFYAEDRLAKNETLDCRLDEANYLEQVRYSRGRQRAIQEARKLDGWTYRGEIISAMEKDGGIVIELVQDDYLRHLLSKTSSDALTFEATKRGENDWLLDREEIILDGRTYVKRYAYDAQGRIATESVTYQNDSACGHVIEVVASYVREGERLVKVELTSKSDGFEIEGYPHTTWSGAFTWTYDDRGRISREVFQVISYEKIFRERPRGPMREIVKRMYPQSRAGREIDILRKGDLCSMIGSKMIGNQIDLRPFHSISPNLAVLVPFGVVKLSVDYSYPESFSLPKVVEK